MSECKTDSSDTSKDDTDLQGAQSKKGLSDNVANSSRGNSAIVFLRKGKPKKQMSKSNPQNISKDAKESAKKLQGDVVTSSKKCEMMCFEEASNEFTCNTSIIESYQRNSNKEVKYCFRKLDDGTFAMERKSTDDPDKSESGSRKRGTKTCHQKGRYAHKPLKICFKKRSKTLRKHSDSNEDYPTENKMLAHTKECEASTSNAETQAECSKRVRSSQKTWATFKSLVTRQKKLHSSFKRHSLLNSQLIEKNASNSYVQGASKKKRFSNLQIPCMNFSRNKKSGNNNIPVEETQKSTETPVAELGLGDERRDEVLAIKYKLQQSLDVENGISERDTEHCIPSFRTVAEYQSLVNDDINKDQLTEHKDTKKDESMQLHNTDSIVFESNNKDDKYMENIKSKGHFLHLSSEQEQALFICGVKNSECKKDTCCDKGYMNETSLMNVTNMVSLVTDPYEMLLMTTAASLVKNVIQSSIQQLLDEGTYQNLVPS